MKHPTRVGDIVAGNHSLRALFDQAARLRALEQQIRSWLDDETLAAHVRVAALREETLVLTVDSPAWGVRLRYLEPVIVARAADTVGFPPIRGVRVRVTR